MQQTSLSTQEISKFEAMAEDWWNPYGNFKPLHDITPIRLEYIISLVKQHLKMDYNSIVTLDIGCGGGLISEPLARLGFDVTGVDASSINIEIAKNHAKQQNLKINYKKILAEQIKNKKFKLILALEILEHVDNIEFFVKTCFNLLEPGGLIIFSTINKTVKSFLQSIIAAEYILKWLPVGTHSWSKFVKPSEINKSASGKLLDLKGLAYAPISKSWYLTDDISNNYFMAYTI